MKKLVLTLIILTALVTQGFAQEETTTLQKVRLMLLEIVPDSAGLEAANARMDLIEALLNASVIDSGALADLNARIDSTRDAISAKADSNSQTFTGTISLPSTTSIGTVSSAEIGYLDNVTSAVQTQLNGKQNTLVSGTNIKTINNTSLLGSGNITVTGGEGVSQTLLEQMFIESQLIYVKGQITAEFKDSAYTYCVYTDSVFNDPVWTYTDSLCTDTIAVDSNRIEVLVQLKTNVSFVKLGGCTIPIQFDSTLLTIGSPADTSYYIYTDTLYAVYNPADSTYSDTAIVVDSTMIVTTMEDSTDYVFHNFSGGDYGAATVTHPLTNVVWLNILPQDTLGTSVGSQWWTSVVTLTFTATEAFAEEGFELSTLVFTWLTTSPYWAVFDSNNLNLWNTHEL